MFRGKRMNESPQNFGWRLKGNRASKWVFEALEWLRGLNPVAVDKLFMVRKIQSCRPYFYDSRLEARTSRGLGGSDLQIYCH